MNTSTLFDLADRVAIVTGGNGGIGRAIALGFARAGASIAIIGRNEEKNQQVLNELDEIGNPASALRVDLSHRTELEPALNRINGRTPGWIETDMTAPVKTLPMNDEIMARTPAGRWGQPEELVGTAVFLASQASDFVTGSGPLTFSRQCAGSCDMTQVENVQGGQWHRILSSSTRLQ